MSGRFASRIPRPADLRAAGWALGALRDLRSRLGVEGPDATVTDPPPLPAPAVRAVRATLRARRASCLEGAMILQRWHAAHGRPLDLVIGVSAPGPDFHAHAWLEGEDSLPGGELTEILRRPAATSDRV